jgi:hypothetical protein
MTRKVLVVLLMVAAVIAVTAALATADGHEAMVYVGHGIPGEDVDQDPALPVDVIVGEECTLDDFEFGEFAGPLPLPAGAYSVTVALSDEDPDTCAGTPVIGPVNVEFEGGDNVTIFAHLTGDGNPGPEGVDVLELGITASVFDNAKEVEDIVAGHTRLTVRHTAWAPAVDIILNRGWIRGREIGDPITDLANGAETEPQNVRPGAYAISIFPAGGDEAVYQTMQGEPFVTHPHQAQIVYAVGSLENETFMLLTQILDLGHTPPPRPMPPGG